MASGETPISACDCVCVREGRQGRWEGGGAFDSERQKGRPGLPPSLVLRLRRPSYLTDRSSRCADSPGRRTRRPGLHTATRASVGASEVGTARRPVSVGVAAALPVTRPADRPAGESRCRYCETRHRDSRLSCSCVMPAQRGVAGRGQIAASRVGRALHREVVRRAQPHHRRPPITSGAYLLAAISRPKAWSLHVGCVSGAPVTMQSARLVCWHRVHILDSP